MIFQVHQGGGFTKEQGFLLYGADLWGVGSGYLGEYPHDEAAVET